MAEIKDRNSYGVICLDRKICTDMNRHTRIVLGEKHNIPPDSSLSKQQCYFIIFGG
jgi:hypothetical protein